MQRSIPIVLGAQISIARCVLVFCIAFAALSTQVLQAQRARRRPRQSSHMVAATPELVAIESAPVPYQAERTVAATPVGIDVIANQEGIGLHIITGNSSGTGVAAGYGWSTSVRTSGRSMESVCVAPCTAPLEPGTYNLAVSHETETPQVLRHLTRVEPGSRLRLEYSSRLLHRWIGAGLVALSILPPMLPLLPDFATSQGSTRQDWFVGGSVACVSMMIVGLALVFLNDHYDIKVERGAVVF